MTTGTKLAENDDNGNALAKKNPHQFLVCLRSPKELTAFYGFLTEHRHQLLAALSDAKDDHSMNRAALFPHEGEMLGWKTEGSFVKAELRARKEAGEKSTARLECYVLALATGVARTDFRTPTARWAEGLVDDAKAIMAAVDAEVAK